MLLFSASGTGAMDSAVANLTAAGDRVAVVVAGAFGERWTKICAQYGLDVQRIDYEWGEVPDPAEIGAAVAESGAEIVFCTQSETSTGVVADVQAIKAAVGDATLVVDAVSSLGAVPLETDAWGIDVVVSGSQKALMCPPGLAMASRRRAPLGPAAAVADVLLRLARDAEGAGGVRLGLHARGLADPRSRRRARDDPRRRPRRRVRAPRPARPGYARRPEGDGARAVLARRRLLGRRHRGACRPTASSRPRCSGICASGTASRSRPVRVRSSRASSGSATSAGSTSSTSPPRSRRSSSR